MMVVAGLALETLWDLDKRVVIPTLDVSKYHFVDQAVPRHILGAGISSIELSCGVAREKPMNSAASSAAIASSPSVVQPQQPAIASAPASSTVPEECAEEIAQQMKVAFDASNFHGLVVLLFSLLKVAGDSSVLKPLAHSLFLEFSTLKLSLPLHSLSVDPKAAAAEDLQDVLRTMARIAGPSLSKATGPSIEILQKAKGDYEALQAQQPEKTPKTEVNSDAATALVSSLLCGIALLCARERAKVFSTPLGRSEAWNGRLLSSLLAAAMVPRLLRSLGAFGAWLVAAVLTAAMLLVSPMVAGLWGEVWAALATGVLPLFFFALPLVVLLRRARARNRVPTLALALGLATQKGALVLWNLIESFVVGLEPWLGALCGIWAAVLCSRALVCDRDGQLPMGSSTPATV
ncbi:unnamed protein product [Durusdinium trenchii]|uniref:Uncharacterized protein n=1 Tax=Durusdinium trenchii TaxID=1381693 RepID=A0ABP0SE01_9DINO